MAGPAAVRAGRGIGTVVGYGAGLRAAGTGVWRIQLATLVRPIYSRMGILPEVASGVQSATDLPQPPAH